MHTFIPNVNRLQSGKGWCTWGDQAGYKGTAYPELDRDALNL